MKAIIVFLIVALIQPFAVAQKIIPRIGITKTSITFRTNYVESQPKYSYIYGVGVEFPISDKILLHPEISYVGKGANFNDYTQKNKLSLNYIDCSFLIKRNLVNKKHKLQAYVGPSVGIGIGGKYSNYLPEKYSYDVKFTSFPKSGYDLKYYAYVDKRFELGLNAGISLEFFKKILFDIRFEQGLTKLYGTDNRGEYDNHPILKAKNRLWQFSIGVPITLKKHRNNNSESYYENNP